MFVISFPKLQAESMWSYLLSKFWHIFFTHNLVWLMLQSKACVLLADIIWRNKKSFCLMKNIWYFYVQVHELLQIYNEHDIPSERLLFKIPATWQVSLHCINLLSVVWFIPADSMHFCHQLVYNHQGIEASRLLESEGTQTHLTFVYRYVRALCLIWSQPYFL